MSNAIDLIVSKQAQEQLDKLLKDLQIVNKEIVEINKRQINFNNSSAPKSISDLRKNTSELSVVEKERLRVQRQLEVTNARIAIANDKNTKSLQNQKTALRTLNSAYAELSAREKEAALRVQDLIARGKLATQTQKQYNAELRKAQEDFNRLNARVMQADTAVKRFNRNVGNYPQQAVMGIKNLMAAFGVVGGLMLFAGVMRDSFNTIKDFDKANADLAATMGTNRNQIKALTEDQKRLGASTKFTATEVAGLQKEFAKLGFSQKEILNATEATLALAAATDTELAKAAEVAGATLRGFGLDASEMARVTDVMALSFSSSALDMENFAESMKYVAPIAGQTGVSIEFTTAMLGKLADAGVKGSQAGTSLRRILVEMAKTGKPAAEAFRQIAREGISVTDAMDEVGRTAQTSLLVLSKSGDAVNELANALEKAGGAAQKMADEQLNSLQGEITLLSSAWDGFILSLNSGDGVIAKTFSKLVSYLRSAVEWMTKLNKIDFFNNENNILRKRQEVLDAIYNDEIAGLQNLNEEKRKLRKEEVAELVKQAEEEIKIAESRINLHSSNIAQTLGVNEFVKAEQKRLEQQKQALKGWKEELEIAKTLLKANAEFIPTTNDLTKATEENTKANDKNKKSKQGLEKVETNSQIAFQRNISALEKQLKATNKASIEYGFLEVQLELLKSAYDALYGSQKKVNEETVKLDFSEEVVKIDEWSQSVIEAGNALRQFLNEHRQGFVDDFIGQSGFDKLFYLIDNFENLKESGVDTALAISEAFQQAFNTISQASQANFEREYDRLAQQKEISLQFAGDSVTAKEEIERQYEERRRQIQRQQAESQKRLAIFNIVTDTAQAILATLAQTPPPAGIPLAALIGSIGAIQLGVVASQPIPAFATGGTMGHDGMMLVNDAKGSNYRETIETPDGKFIQPKGRNVLMNAKKGTKIYTPEQWDMQLNSMLGDVGIAPISGMKQNFVNINNGLTKSDMYEIMSKFANKDSYNFSIDEKGIQKTIIRGGQKVNIANKRLKIRKEDV